MRTDAHSSVTKAEVRERTLTRHQAARCDGGKAWAIVSGVGLPRTWGYTGKAALEGFERGLEQTASGPAARLEQAYEGARERLRRRCDALLEKMVPDAVLVGLLLGAGELHVVTAGPGRVYLHRRGDAQRLTPREESAGGLLGGIAARCSTALEPGDVVIAGSISAFTVKSVSRIASVLEADRETSPAVLASLLTEPAGQAGIGAAAVVLRVR